MLAGLDDQGSLGGSMFEHLRLDMRPSAEDMEAEAERMKFNKVVKMKSFFVETYNLGDKTEAKAYAKLMEKIYGGIQAKTHVILFNDRHFVEEGGNPRWVAHIEWAEYELVVTPNQHIASAAEGETKNGKDSR